MDYQKYVGQFFLYNWELQKCLSILEFKNGEVKVHAAIKGKYELINFDAVLWATKIHNEIP